MPEKLKKIEVTGIQLKILALLTMTIDHMGAVLFPSQIWMRVVGRIAFPVYCFLLVEGFTYTRSRKEYLKRLLVFAVISEIPFDMAFFGKAFYMGHQNVFFTLFIGFLTMYFCEYATSDISRYIMCFAGLMLSGLLRTDYSYFGIATILVFYLFRKQRFMAVAIQSVMNILEFSIQSAAVMAFIPISLYRGRRGKKMLQIGFYAFYPIHLIILHIIKCIG